MLIGLEEIKLTIADIMALNYQFVFDHDEGKVHVELLSILKEVRSSF